MSNGVVLSATGNKDSVGYAFNSEVTSTGEGNVVIKWRADYGTKYLDFVSEATIRASEAVRMKVATKSSEFKSFEASFEAFKTPSGIEVLTTIKEDVVTIMEAHLLLENSSMKKGLIATIKTGSATLVDVQVSNICCASFWFVGITVLWVEKTDIAMLCLFFSRTNVCIPDKPERRPSEENMMPFRRKNISTYKFLFLCHLP